MGDRAKILLVDDDPDFIESTKIVLESKPYDIITAGNGDEGIKKARQEKPDLIILDVIMPVQDGFSAADALKKDAELSKIPVIMLTSFADKRGETSVSVSQGMALDAEDYIDKPVTPEVLLKRVERLLR